MLCQVAPLTYLSAQTIFLKSIDLNSSTLSIILLKLFKSGFHVCRVLNLVIRSNDLKKARERVIELIKQLDWTNGFFRKDIGF